MAVTSVLAWTFRVTSCYGGASTCFSCSKLVCATNGILSTEFNVEVAGACLLLARIRNTPPIMAIFSCLYQTGFRRPKAFCNTNVLVVPIRDVPFTSSLAIRSSAAYQFS